MNLDQLVDEVNKDLDESLDAGEITAWFNRALDDLSPITKKETKYSVEISSSITLPDDLLEIVFVMADDSELYPVQIQDKTSKGYKVWGNELTLQNAPESGLLEVYYYKRLSHLSESEDIPEIESSFHDLLILYAVAHYRYADEEPELQMNAMNRYFQRKQEYESFVSYNSNTVYQVRVIGEII